jgi:LacI family transcriptional regulator
MGATGLTKPRASGFCRSRGKYRTPQTWQRGLCQFPRLLPGLEFAYPEKSVFSTTNFGAVLGMQFVNRPVHALGEEDTKAFKELAQSGVNGIILTAGNPEGLKPLIDDAEENGIRVVCVSTDAPKSARSSIVCVEPRLNGRLAGELMGKFVPPGSKVAVVAGMLTAEDHRKKTDGFSDAFPRHCAGGKIVNVIEGHEDEDESFQKTFDLLGGVPTLAGLYVNTVNCLPVCRALGARGLAGKVKLITTDLFAEMSPYFEKGTITASIYQQPHRQGQMAVRLMADHLTNKIPFPPTVHLSPGVVMSSNLHLFREIRLATAKFDDSLLSTPSHAKVVRTFET